MKLYAIMSETGLIHSFTTSEPDGQRALDSFQPVEQDATYSLVVVDAELIEVAKREVPRVGSEAPADPGSIEEPEVITPEFPVEPTITEQEDGGVFKEAIDA